MSKFKVGDHVLVLFIPGIDPSWYSLQEVYTVTEVLEPSENGEGAIYAE